MRKQSHRLFKNDNKRLRNNANRDGREDYTKSKHNEITALYKVNHSTELLEFLLAKCKTSRNNVKQLLVSKKVLVNGSVVSQYNFMLAKDDEVKICKNANKSISKLPKRVSASNVKLPFKIIYEDDDFIAINKPNGLLSVESDNSSECAFGYLLNYFQGQDKNYRPYILHRIDKETSGVLVFTKNIKLHSMLKLNWNDYVKTREYIAVVEGTLENKKGTITSFLKENKNNMVYSTKDVTGQKAITNYEVIKETEDYSLLKVNILTGRKNQIRVHMQDIKHAVVGDDKYGHNKNPLNRLGLHASKLEFLHPVTKQLISIYAPVPENFNRLFNK